MSLRVGSTRSEGHTPFAKRSAPRRSPTAFLSVAERERAFAPKRSAAETRSAGASTKVRSAAQAGERSEAADHANASGEEAKSEKGRSTRGECSKSRTSERPGSRPRKATLTLLNSLNLQSALRSRIFAGASRPRPCTSATSCAVARHGRVAHHPEHRQGNSCAVRNLTTSAAQTYDSHSRCLRILAAHEREVRLLHRRVTRPGLAVADRRGRRARGSGVTSAAVPVKNASSAM